MTFIDFWRLLCSLSHLVTCYVVYFPLILVTWVGYKSAILNFYNYRVDFQLTLVYFGFSTVLQIFGLYFTTMSVVDKFDAARHLITGSYVAKVVCKASSREIMGPKRKHLDCKFYVRTISTDFSFCWRTRWQILSLFSWRSNVLHFQWQRLYSQFGGHNIRKVYGFKLGCCFQSRVHFPSSNVLRKRGRFFLPG